MKKFEISYPNWNMRKELAYLWQVCFDDSQRPVNYFFDNYFNTHNCLVGLIDGKAAAAVHLLPAHMITKDGLVNAHYIYAAATMPEYRGKGYMSRLINAAAYTGRNRGDQYSFLLPANEELYRFYEKLNYMRYFKIRQLTLSHEELCSVAASGKRRHVQLKNKQITAVRNAQLSKQYGSIIWDTKAVAYAVESNRLYGGHLISAGIRDKSAYALCRIEKKGICEVMELSADLSILPDLFANILSCIPAKYYRIKLPCNNNLFKDKGEVLNYGMIKSLNKDATDILGENPGLSYLGLTLD